jgi:hypothetical protein
MFPGNESLVVEIPCLNRSCIALCIDSWLLSPCRYLLKSDEFSKFSEFLQIRHHGGLTTLGLPTHNIKLN